MQQRILKSFNSGFLVFLFTLFVSVNFINSAAAQINCRELARDVQRQGLKIDANNSNDVVALLTKLFESKLATNPECSKELQILWDWNRAQDPTKEFPFPAIQDKRPIVIAQLYWWWNTIYHGLFDGNTLLMFLFGWEIFLAPWPFIFMIFYVLISVIAIPFIAFKNKLKGNGN